MQTRCRARGDRVLAFRLRGLREAEKAPHAGHTPAISREIHIPGKACGDSALARKLRPEHCASRTFDYHAAQAPTDSPFFWCFSSSRVLNQLENCGRRLIMADQPNNQGERMDERSGRNPGVGGGAGSSSLSGTMNSTRSDSGVETRNTATVTRKTPRGFAAMDPQAQRAIAAKGGRAAHQKGTAHEFTSEEARIAGRKGGEASRGGRRSSVSSESTG